MHLGHRWYACLAGKDNYFVDSSRSLVRYELADEEVAHLASTDNSKVLVPRHVVESNVCSVEMLRLPSPLFNCLIYTMNSYYTTMTHQTATLRPETVTVG